MNITVFIFCNHFNIYRGPSCWLGQILCLLSRWQFVPAWQNSCTHPHYLWLYNLIYHCSCKKRTVYSCLLCRAGHCTWEDHSYQSTTYKGTSGGLAISLSACDDHQATLDTMVSSHFMYLFFLRHKSKLEDNTCMNYISNATIPKA